MKDEKDKVCVDGVVLDVLPNYSFLIKLSNEIIVYGYLSGKMQMKNIQVLKNDRVKVEVSKYAINEDKIRVRIIYREKRFKT